MPGCHACKVTPTIWTRFVWRRARTPDHRVAPDAGLNLGSVTELQNQLTGVLLQHVLLNASSAAQLVAEGTINSALGELLNASYPVTVKSGKNVSIFSDLDPQTLTAPSNHADHLR